VPKETYYSAKRDLLHTPVDNPAFGFRTHVERLIQIFIMHRLRRVVVQIA
jgi:hypothetical protein